MYKNINYFVVLSRDSTIKRSILYFSHIAHFGAIIHKHTRIYTHALTHSRSTTVMLLLFTQIHKGLLHFSRGQWLCSEVKLQEEKHLSQWSVADDPPCWIPLELLLPREDHRKLLCLHWTELGEVQHEGGIGGLLSQRAQLFQDTGYTLDIFLLTLPMVHTFLATSGGLSLPLAEVMVCETGRETLEETMLHLLVERLRKMYLFFLNTK